MWWLLQPWLAIAMMNDEVLNIVSTKVCDCAIMINFRAYNWKHDCVDLLSLEHLYSFHPSNSSYPCNYSYNIIINMQLL